MKHTRLWIPCVLCALLLGACRGGLVNFSYKDGQLVNRRLKLAYNAASTNYQPVAIGDAYGYFKDSDMTLYEIAGLDPTEWLTQEYVGNATTIFYNENIHLPTLPEMEADKILVCENQDIPFSWTTVDDAEVVDSLVTLFTTDPGTEWPMLDALQTYALKFSSPLYPHIYYNLMYYEYAEGVFLYDRNAKKCVEIGDILEEWIENSWEA